jgi:hypothetical protein
MAGGGGRGEGTSDEEDFGLWPAGRQNGVEGGRRRPAAIRRRRGRAEEVCGGDVTFPWRESSDSSYSVQLFEPVRSWTKETQKIFSVSTLGLIRLCRIILGIVLANQSLYKLEKQSGSESFRPTNPTQTNKVLRSFSIVCFLLLIKFII